MTLRRILLATLMTLVAGVGLAPSRADAYYFGRNKVQTDDVTWQVLVTPHFEITHVTEATDLAVRASIIAERTYREYADRLDHDLEKRVPFILYASHSAFAQTNISDELLGEGTGGFTEPMRNRMVLPYAGSHADFVHVIRHEMVHVFMFDMVFGSSRNQISRSPFFRIPLWFAEGIAEWYSSGWDAQADMYVRDATTNDYLWPLSQVGGFMVYKQGQAAARMISETYGEEKLVEMWRALARLRSMDRAVSHTLGLDREDLNRDFQLDMRRRYWPSFGHLEPPDEAARRLTDHVEEKIGFNHRPAISPDGRHVAYFSDRDGLVSLYLMSALDGKVLRRLAQGYRANRFENLRPFQSDIAFDPTGREVAFIARSGNTETLHTIDVASGDVTRSLSLGLDGATSPTWSPDGRWLALVGTVAGRTDLYLLDFVGGDGGPARFLSSRGLDGGVRIMRITDDVGDEASPAWSPDGSTLAFAHNPRAEVIYEFEVDEDGARRLLWARYNDGDGAVAAGHEQPADLVLLNPFTGTRHALAPAAGAWRDPVWIGDRDLCVVADGNGVDNLALLQLAPGAAVVDSVRILTNVAGAVSQPSYAPAADRLVFGGFHRGGWDVYCADEFATWRERDPAGEAPGPVALSPPVLSTRDAPPRPIADPDKVGEIHDYHPRFSVDMSGTMQGGVVSFSPQAGLAMANMIHLSDLLGDHRMTFLVNVYGSLGDSDLAASYAYLKRRIDVGVGLFHYKSYYNSVLTSVGEVLPRDTFFSERNYGFFATAAYPFSTFERLSFSLQAMASEQTNYSVDPSGLYLSESAQVTYQLLQPMLTYTHDSAYYGYYGPITGSRLLMQFTPTVPVGGKTLSRQTAVFDYRHYWLPWRRNSIAVRLLAAGSFGADSRAFVLGGPFTLRGYDFYDYQTTTHLAGPKFVLMNLEYRLPLLDALIFGWPVRWGFGPIGATLFFDAGAAWTDTFQPCGYDSSGRWGLEDLRGAYGIGIRTALGFIPLKFDWGRRTDLRGAGRTEFHFSIGPEF